MVADVCNLGWTAALQVCPQTCLACASKACFDDDQTPFLLQGQLYDCEWLRVTLVVSGGAFKNKICLKGGAMDICRQTCGNCDPSSAAATAPPTSLGNHSPTSLANHGTHHIFLTFPDPILYSDPILCTRAQWGKCSISWC